MNKIKTNRLFKEAVNTADLLKAQQSEKISEVEDKAKEVQNPVYADATRQMKKTAKVKADTVKVEAEPKHEEKPKKPKMAPGAKKMQLDESLFEASYNAQEVYSDEENKTYSKYELGMTDKSKLSDEDRRMIARRKLSLDKKAVRIDPKDNWTDEERRDYARQELGLKGGNHDATPNSNYRRHISRNN